MWKCSFDATSWRLSEAAPIRATLRQSDDMGRSPKPMHWRTVLSFRSQSSQIAQRQS